MPIDTYIICRFLNREKEVKYRIYPVSCLERGLFDWSGGREVLAGFARYPNASDLWTAQLSENEADAIREGRVIPRPVYR